MAEPQRKRCLYEVLGVTRDASSEEIRSSYRRLALQLHPDKIAASSGGVASPAATAAFQELLHAYEVLSDPKERSYYDSHRSQILFSDPSSSTSSKHKKSSFFDVDLYSFFSNSSFSGFSDTGRGFYKVYGDLLAKIYSQEVYFAKELALGADAVAPAPLIGNLESPYSQVTAFYNYWLGFCTVMDFGWVDEYDASMGPNRRSRRVMEEENKKIRKKARREYNESVRGLAAFVKKRDKRVIDMLMKKKAEEEKRREEEKSKKKEEEMRRMERVKAYEEPEWARVDDEFDIDDGSEDDEKKKKGKGGEEFYCVVCNKKFKSDKQWKNHEQSKKHKDKVADLKMLFKEEDDGSVDDEEEEVRVGFDYEPPEAEDSFSDAVDELCDDVKDDLQLPGENADGDSMEGSDHDEASMLEAMLSGRKNRKGGYMRHDVPTSNEDDHPGNDEDDSMEYNNCRKNRKHRSSRRDTSAKTGPEDVKDDSKGPNQNGAEVSDISNQERTAANIEEGPSSSVEEAEITKKNKRDKIIAKKQISKKQQVDSKGAGKREADDVFKTSSKGRKQKGISSKAPVNACGTCGENFESRNKLFAHLGDTGHAMLKSR